MSDIYEMIARALKITRSEAKARVFAGGFSDGWKRYLNPLEAPYGQELVLHDHLGAEFYGRTVQPKDPADDGAEVMIIRQTKLRSGRYYEIEINLALALRAREDEHIWEVERKFNREVDALAKPSARPSF